MKLDFKSLENIKNSGEKARSDEGTAQLLIESEILSYLESEMYHFKRWLSAGVWSRN